MAGTSPEIGAGWLTGLRQIPSPNCNARPPGVEIDLLVIHGISLPPGCFLADSPDGGHIDALFCNRLDPAVNPYFEGLQGLTVSAHFFISRAGQVTQYVSLDCRAWHAGVSSWEGRPNCNDYSVGIELEGADDVPYTDAQYDALVSLVRLVMRHCPAMTPERIVGHSDVAPGRKTDPGPAFEWLRFRAALQGN